MQYVFFSPARIYSLLNERSGRAVKVFLGSHAASNLWHSSVIAYNNEYFFGTKGIHRLDPKRGDEIMGMKSKLIYPAFKLNISEECFLQYLDRVSRGSCHFKKYHFLKWNCTDFVELVLQWVRYRELPYVPDFVARQDQIIASRSKRAKLFVYLARSFVR